MKRNVLKNFAFAFSITFLLSFLIAGSCGRDQDPQPPVARFSYVTAQTFPATVTFTNTSTSPSGPSVYKWEFGDGTPAVMGADQVHQYAAPGTYTVKLIQIPAGAPNDTLIKVIQLTSTGPSGNSNRSGNVQTANFNFSIAYNTYIITFNNTSTGSGNTYMWDFGDGVQANTNAASVNHTYTASGTYHVVLAATNSQGVDTSGATITLQ